MADGMGMMMGMMMVMMMVMGMGMMMLTGMTNAQLMAGYYSHSCPSAESIIRESVVQTFNKLPTSAPATLRIFFHDCMVDGCDGSILISSTKKSTAERDAEANLSLDPAGFTAVNKAKEAVEKVCPGIVSCADVLAVATRDFLFLVGGAMFNFSVETGRRDGRVSNVSKVADNLPGSNQNLDQLIAKFRRKNISMEEIVALSGAHSIGFTHCKEFSRRIHGKNGFDPNMDAKFAHDLLTACPRGVNPNVTVHNDVTTPNRMDNSYYKNLVGGKGVMGSDQLLFTDRRTRALVLNYSKRSAVFAEHFVQALIHLGRVGVKTGNVGEIRRHCSSFNN